MLKELYIQNIAVIDELRLEFGQGFHVLTGETGAGKSILVEAIGLILGEKARGPLIRDGANEAVVEAVFDIKKFPTVKERLQEDGVTNEDEVDVLVIRRVVSHDGKNKILINQRRVTLAFLQEIGAHLIDYTGQHQQTELLDAGNDLAVLDGFLADETLKENYSKAYFDTKIIDDEIVALEKSLLEKNERLEWIRYQLKELEELQIESESEEAELKKSREQIKHASVITRFADNAGQVLAESDQSCVNGLSLLQREAERHPALLTMFGGTLEKIKEIKIQIEDLAYEIARTSAKSEGVASHLTTDEIESRLFTLEKLKRKFGPELVDVLKKRTDLQEEKSRLDHSDERLEELKKNRLNNLKVLRGYAEKLSAARAKVAAQLEKAVLKELAELRMGDARFVIEVKLSGNLEDWASYSSNGADAVRFLLAPNPGLALKPLAQIASGGEISRIFLAIKQVLTQKRAGGTLIFDEIDTGLSGATVELTGLKLKALAHKFQVFCITHHAQIAGLSDRHYFVSKAAKKGKTSTQVDLLAGEAKIHEVARLMGGVKISEKNLAFAREMVRK